MQKNYEDMNDLSDLENIDLPFNIHDVRPQCVKCIRKQLEKFKNNVDESKKSLKNRFVVDCTGVLKNPVDLKYKKLLSPTEWDQILGVYDPVYWAAKYITHPDGSPWIARPYQEEVMRCTSKRKVLRIGRRCLTGDTPILMATGKWKPIEEIKTGEYVVSRKLSGGIPVNKKVINKFDNGIQDVYEIKLTDGRSITCTDNHPILVNQTNKNNKGMSRVYKTIQNGLVKGNKVVVLKHNDSWGTKHNPELGLLLGYMLTDGYFGQYGQTPKFTNNNKRMIDEVSELSYKLFKYKCPIRSKGNGYDLYITDGDKKTENLFSKLINELELTGIKAKRKQIPSVIFDYNKETLMGLINRMFSGDGCVGVYTRKKKREKLFVNTPHPELSLVSTSIQILNQVRLILLKLNINSSISKEERIINKPNDKLSILYKLRIGDSVSIINFFNEVGLIYGKEKQSLKVLKTAQNIKKRRKQGSKNFKTITIKSITYKGKQQTYDIEVNHTHNFIANGIISHNSGKTELTSIEICWKIFTNSNRRVLVGGPQKVHVQEIFDRIRGFTQRNSLLANELDRDVSSPHYEILLKNASRIRGFALGTRGKSEGVAARGQNADDCYVDELAYVDEKAIVGALFPILQTTKECTMTGFSTPTGFKDIYYSMCKELPNYVEFHHNYKVLPHWKEVEKDRPQYTEEEWEHEFLAEFGSSESGVFKPSYIDRSLRGYSYETTTPQAGWRYIMGVDWNEKHGAEIVVVGENVSGGFYQVMDAVCVEKSEFTQLSSIQNVISMYRRWNPIKIYADAGNGCLDKDSLVYTINGLKKIQNIKVDDLVLTHKGKFNKVTNIVNTGKKESFKIKPGYSLYTIASDLHKHIIYRSKDRFNDFNNFDKNNYNITLTEITTNELDINRDFFVIPKQDISNIKNEYIVDLVEELKDIPNILYDEKYIWTKYGYSTTPKLSAIYIVDKYKISKPTVHRTRKSLRNNIKLTPVQQRFHDSISKDYGEDWYKVEYKKINRFINILDKDFLNLYGWYLSEGYAGVNNIEICQASFHNQKEFNKLIEYCSKNWECNVLIKPSGIIRLFILSSVLNEFLKKIGGSGCYNKFIDSRIINNNGIALLPSLFIGDGHEHKHGVNLSMTSDTLVYQTRQMLINNGLLGGLHRVNPRERKDEYNSAKQLMFYLNATEENYIKINNILKTNVNPRYGVFRRKNIELNNYFLVPLKEIKHIGLVDDMYDLTIEKDSTFCVNGFATHNSTNLELMRKMSNEQRKPRGDVQLAKLIDVLKAYDSGASIETKDPVTNDKRKVPAKPYMVNAAVRAFEQDKVRISSADKELEKQLRNYIIDRISPTGTPVYATRDNKIKDHRLDAFNLAMVGFFREFGGLQKENIIMQVVATVNPRTKQIGYNKESVKEADPSERRLDGGEQSKSVLNNQNGVPGKVSVGHIKIAQTNSGWEYDLEEEYHNRYLQKQRKKARVGKGTNPIRRTNI